MSEYICLLIAIGSTFYIINYKISTTIRIFLYQEKEESKYAIFIFCLMIIAVFAWTTYLVCF